jgi:hypothetical protein
LLILTATTTSDELSYGLNDTAVDGWFLDRLELGVDRRGRRRPTRWLRSWTPAPYDGAAACAEEGGVINCK